MAREGVVAVPLVLAWRFAVKRFSRLLTVFWLVVGALLATGCDEAITGPEVGSAQFTRAELPSTEAQFGITTCATQATDSTSKSKSRYAVAYCNGR